MPGPRGMPACPKDFVDFAGHLADAARDVVLRYFRQPFDIENKADDSPVTIADREAEAAMRAAIADRLPEHGVVGEEYGPDRPEAEYVWVLDPIDGTKRFVTGNPQFGTLIGLLHRGRPVLGVIAMPAMEERWSGAAGHPTLHSDRRGTREVRARACAELSNAALYSTSPLMFLGADLEAFERVRTKVGMPLYGGDCYSYGLLASGFNDLTIEASMGVYDYLPLVAVIEGAGGVITDWRGRPLNLKSDGRVAAAGDARCHAAALDLLTSA